MSLEENFNNKNRRRQHPEEEDLFDDVEIESEELFPDEDEDEKDVLMFRYIGRMKWEDICVRMNLSWRRVHYIHSDALEHFIL